MVPIKLEKWWNIHLPRKSKKQSCTGSNCGCYYNQTLRAKYTKHCDGNCNFAIKIKLKQQIQERKIIKDWILRIFIIICVYRLCFVRSFRYYNEKTKNRNMGIIEQTWACECRVSFLLIESERTLGVRVRVGVEFGFS